MFPRASEASHSHANAPHFPKGHFFFFYFLPSKQVTNLFGFSDPSNTFLGLSVHSFLLVFLSGFLLWSTFCKNQAAFIFSPSPLLSWLFLSASLSEAIADFSWHTAYQSPTRQGFSETDCAFFFFLQLECASHITKVIHA